MQLEESVVQWMKSNFPPLAENAGVLHFRAAAAQTLTFETVRRRHTCDSTNRVYPDRLEEREALEKTDVMKESECIPVVVFIKRLSGEATGFFSFLFYCGRGEDESFFLLLSY